MRGKLVVQDGSVYEGTLIGQKSNSFGELVFTTAMVGYQESLTDPSYMGQLVMFAYPLIGNYGIEKVSESNTIQANGTVISNLYEHSTLPKLLKKAGKTGIIGVDTRALVRKIASNGTMLAMITADSVKTAKY
ncbi:MAG: carbamoyl-phosphate synthase domain-containing protein, partial [Thermoplasmata archaeon]